MKNAILGIIAASLLAGNSLTADVVRLKNGDTFTGKILQRADGTMTFKGDLYGELVFQESDVASYKVGATVSAADLDRTETAPSPSTAPVSQSPSSKSTSSTFEGHEDDPQQAKWTRSLTFGGNYVSPTFNQNQIPGAPLGTTGASLGLPGRVLGVQSSASVKRTTLADVHQLDLTQNYTNYAPAGTQSDNYSATFAWNHKINDRFYTVSRSSYSVDQVKNIEYSAVQLLGVGYKFIDTDETKFDVVPGFVALQQAKGNAFDDDLQIGGGFHQSYVHHLHSGASIEQRILLLQSFEEADLYVIEAYLGLKGKISAGLNLMVGLEYIYDNALGPIAIPSGGSTVILFAQKKGQLTLSSSFQFTF